MSSDQIVLAQKIALKLLSKSWKSRKEIELALGENNIDSNIISEVIEYLINKGFINDEKFGYEWARYKILNNSVGPRKLEYGLVRKEVDPDVVQKISDKIWKEFNELELAKSLASKKRKNINTLESSKIKNKIFNFLNNKGFSEEVIEKIINNF